MIGSLKTKVHTALIGVSGYGQIYLDLIQAARARGEITLTAAVIINPGEESAIEAQLLQQGCRIYRDYGEMLNGENGKLDLCLIPTGIPWHARMTIAALQAGANVLVEKPLAGSLAEVAAIRAVEQATGRFVAVGFQDIYSPVNRWLKQQLNAGVIGQLQSVRFLGMWPRPAAYFVRNPWAGRLHALGTPVLDSPLNNAFAHFVNLCLYFASKDPDGATPVQVVSAELLRANAIESFDTSVVRARSSEGISFWFGATHTCRAAREPEIHLEGTKGKVEWKHERSCIVRPSDGQCVERLLPDADANRHTMLSAVIARLSAPGTVICSTALAKQHTAFIEAVHAATPVQAIPASLIQNAPEEADRAGVPVVAGLDRALVRAFEQKSLLRDAGFMLP